MNVVIAFLNALDAPEAVEEGIAEGSISDFDILYKD